MAPAKRFENPSPNSVWPKKINEEFVVPYPNFDLGGIP